MIILFPSIVLRLALYFRFKNVQNYFHTRHFRVHTSDRSFISFYNGYKRVQCMRNNLSTIVYLKT